MLRVFVFVFLFLMIGAFFIVSENNLNLINQNSRKSLINIYTNWLLDLFSNTKNLAGYAVKMEWLPNN